MNKTVINITVVVPCHNEVGNITKLIKETDKYIEKPCYIFIDDGSTDDTLNLLKNLSITNKRVKYISFSRNFGHQAALRAGLSTIDDRVDAVVTMDADLQHPPKLLPEMIKHWNEGNQIVYTKREDNAQNTNIFKRKTSQLFYKIMNSLSGLNMELGAADFRLLDKSVVRVINSMPEKQLFFRGFVAWCGFNQYSLPYKPGVRFSGKSSYNLKKMLSLAIQGITSFSIKPLRIATLFGFASALFGVLYGMYVLFEYLFTDNTVEGWASVVIAVLTIGGIQLIILGIMGEYIGRMFIETKQRPDYIIMEENL
jgi:glycosyltransferase involved in cell wall biosynthesis